MDGARQIDGDSGMNAPASPAKRQRKGAEGSKRRGNCQNDSTFEPTYHPVKTGGLLPFAEASYSDHL